MRKKAYRYTKDDNIFVYQMLILRSQGLSYPQIGRMFNKDHSTVIHWCKRYGVDVGSPIPFFINGVIRINHGEPQKHKYDDILDEPINKGKLTYAEYLRAYK